MVHRAGHELDHGRDAANADEGGGAASTVGGAVGAVVRRWCRLEAREPARLAGTTASALEADSYRERRRGLVGRWREARQPRRLEAEPPSRPIVDSKEGGVGRKGLCLSLRGASLGGPVYPRQRPRTAPADGRSAAAAAIKWPCRGCRGRHARRGVRPVERPLRPTSPHGHVALAPTWSPFQAATESMSIAMGDKP
jgi:hypothetical protein